MNDHHRCLKRRLKRRLKAAASSAIVDAAVIYTRGAPEINRVFVPRRDRLSQPRVANALGTQ